MFIGQTEILVKSQEPIASVQSTDQAVTEGVPKRNGLPIARGIDITPF
jgi:hypothetical protein